MLGAANSPPIPGGEFAAPNMAPKLNTPLTAGASVPQELSDFGFDMQDLSILKFPARGTQV